MGFTVCSWESHTIAGSGLILKGLQPPEGEGLLGSSSPQPPTFPAVTICQLSFPAYKRDFSYTSLFAFMIMTLRERMEAGQPEVLRKYIGKQF